MNAFLLYHASMVAVGAVMAAMSLPTVLSGEFALIPILFSISGVGMVVTSLYNVFVAPESARTVPTDRIVWLTAALAAVAVVATAWSHLA